MEIEFVHKECDAVIYEALIGGFDDIYACPVCGAWFDLKETLDEIHIQLRHCVS